MGDGGKKHGRHSKELVYDVTVVAMLLTQHTHDDADTIDGVAPNSRHVSTAGTTTQYVAGHLLTRNYVEDEDCIIFYGQDYWETCTAFLFLPHTCHYEPPTD